MHYYQIAIDTAGMWSHTHIPPILRPLLPLWVEQVDLIVVIPPILVEVDRHTPNKYEILFKRQCWMKRWGEEWELSLGGGDGMPTTLQLGIVVYGGCAGSLEWITSKQIDRLVVAGQSCSQPIYLKGYLMAFQRFFPNAEHVIVICEVVILYAAFPWLDIFAVADGSLHFGEDFILVLLHMVDCLCFIK